MRYVTQASTAHERWNSTPGRHQQLAGNRADGGALPVVTTAQLVVLSSRVRHTVLR